MWTTCFKIRAQQAIDIRLDIKPARVVSGSARYSSTRYGLARYTNEVESWLGSVC